MIDVTTSPMNGVTDLKHQNSALGMKNINQLGIEATKYRDHFPNTSWRKA